MTTSFLTVQQTFNISGTVDNLAGAKNAVLVIIASLILTDGVSVLTNVPNSSDVHQMINLLRELGAQAQFDTYAKRLVIDTTTILSYRVNAEIMKKMRASILVMGPLLARFGKADIAFPGGCVLGARSVDLHLRNFEKMGVIIDHDGAFLKAHTDGLQPRRLVLGYPSVGATENLVMAAVLTQGTTTIVNAALEPEVLDLFDVLKKMGAQISITAPATVHVTGVATLHAIEHDIIVDRLEVGSLLLAAAITGGSVSLPQARPDHLDVFLAKLEEMGHSVTTHTPTQGISLTATQNPRAVSFKTSPYPGFPTDLQAPMMAAQCIAEGISVVEETVFENRLVHTRELQKMGALIRVEGTTATITGVEELYGAHVIASDIRASCALVLAGMVAKGETMISGIHHFRRGYDNLDLKLNTLGAQIVLSTSPASQAAGLPSELCGV